MFSELRKYEVRDKFQLHESAQRAVLEQVLCCAFLLITFCSRRHTANGLASLSGRCGARSAPQGGTWRWVFCCCGCGGLSVAVLEMQCVGHNDIDSV